MEKLKALINEHLDTKKKKIAACFAALVTFIFLVELVKSFSA